MFRVMLKNSASLFLGIVFSLLLAELTVRGLSAFGAAQPKFFRERPARYYLSKESVDLRGNSSLSCKRDHFCIVILGDSFTFGARMQVEDTFPRRLENLLNLNKKGQPAQVVSLGVSGVNAVQESRLLREFLNNNRPDLIILQVTLNDARLRSLREEPAEVRRSFEPYSPSPGLLLLHEYSYLFRYVAERLHNYRSRTAYINYHKDSFLDSRTGSRFRRAIVTMNDRALQNSTPFAVVLFPLFDFSFDQNYPFSAEHEWIRSLANELKVPFLDLLNYFSGIDNFRLQLMPGSDSHPNEIAHRIASERLLLFLRKNSLVPRENLPEKVYRIRDHIVERQVKQRPKDSVKEP